MTKRFMDRNVAQLRSMDVQDSQRYCSNKLTFQRMFRHPMAARFVECHNLASFVASVAGPRARKCRICDLYGIPLENCRGDRACYVGRTEEGERPEEYLHTLRAPKVVSDERPPEWDRSLDLIVDFMNKRSMSIC